MNPSQASNTTILQHNNLENDASNVEEEDPSRTPTDDVQCSRASNMANDTVNGHNNYAEAVEYDHAYWEGFYGDIPDEDIDNLLNNETTTLGFSNESPQELSTDMTSLFTIQEVFHSHEELTKHLVKFARDHSVVLVKKRTHLNEKRTPTVIFQCERGGNPSQRYVKKVGGTGKNKPRDSKTKKCGCMFAIRGFEDVSTKLWKVAVDNGVHNHKLVKFDQGHAYLGRLTKEETADVRRLSISGVKPMKILHFLRDANGTNCTPPKTLYNTRTKINSDAREGRTVMQELYHLATKTPTFLQCRYDENNVVRDIFWSFEESLCLIRCFPSVMLMDCTYKTNKYKMPQLQIIGVTSTNKSFCVGFALLGLEKEDNYAWALSKLRDVLGDKSHLLGCIVTDKEQALMNAIRLVFPNAKNLICVWHIQKNIVANLKNKNTSKGWTEFMDRWMEVVNVSSEQEFIHRLEELKSSCSKEAMKYLSSTWLDTNKELFVSAWTDTVFHLGNTSTSRVEGMHAKFKNWLSNCLGDAVKGWEAGLKLVEQEMNDIKATFEESIYRVPKELIGEPVFKKVIHNVSHHALNVLYNEYKKSDGSLVTIVDCRCTIKMTLKLPCKHEISRLVRTPGFISLSTIDAHWKTLDVKGPPPENGDLDHEPLLNALTGKVVKASPFEKTNLLAKIRDICAPTQTMLLEPAVKRTGRGRPKGSCNKKKLVVDSSTKREMSLFEHVEKALESVSSNKRVARKTKLPCKRPKVNAKGSVSLKDEADDESFKEEVPDLEYDDLRWEEELENFSNDWIFEAEVHDGSVKVEVHDGSVKKELDDDSLKVEVHDGSSNPLPRELTVGVLEFFKYHFKPEIVQYILSYKNVLGDGNCGFRVIADFVYRDNEMWARVKQDLKDELSSDIDHYKEIFENNSDFAISKCVTIFDHMEGSCLDKNEYWFDSLLGWIVCNTYGVVLSVLSLDHGCQTFFPTKIKPSSETPLHIWIGFINGNHFIRLYMKKNCPVPRVTKRWVYVHNHDVGVWYNMFKERIGLWEVLYPNPDSWEGHNVLHA